MNDKNIPNKPSKSTALIKTKFSKSLYSPQKEHFKPNKSLKKYLSGRDMVTTMHIYFDRETIKGMNEFPQRYNPSKLIIYLALITIILSNVGSYFNYDINQILDDNFRIRFKVSVKEVVQLYTIYYLFSFPLTILGGFLISYIGAITTVVILTFIIFVGSVSTVYGSMTENFNYVWIGRAFDGISAELNDIAINSVISIWFKGKFLSLAISLAQFCNSLSSTLSTFLSIRIMEGFRDITKVFIIASFLCGFSSICTLIFQFLDLKRERVNRELKAKNMNNDSQDEKISFDMIKNLNNKQIWGMVITASISDAIYFCFTFFTTGLLTKRFFFNVKESSTYMALLPTSAMISSPIFGALTVKFGKKMSMLLIGYVIIISGLLALFFMPFKKSLIVSIPLIIVGIFKGLNSSLIWSGVALVTPESSVPLGFCIIELSSNLLTAGISFVFGEIIEDEKKENFQTLILIMVVLCCFGFGVTVYTMKHDADRGGILELPENELKAVGIKKIIDFRGNKKTDILKYLKFAEEQEEESEEEI